MGAQECAVDCSQRVASMIGYCFLLCWLIGAFLALLMPLVVLSTPDVEVNTLTWVLLSVFYYMPLAYCMGSKQWGPPTHNPRGRM